MTNALRDFVAGITVAVHMKHPVLYEAIKNRAMLGSHYTPPTLYTDIASMGDSYAAVGITTPPDLEAVGNLVLTSTA